MWALHSQGWTRLLGVLLGAVWSLSLLALFFLQGGRVAWGNARGAKQGHRQKRVLSPVLCLLHCIP